MRLRHAGAGGALAVAAGAAAWLAVRALRGQPPLLWDEAEHALHGVEVLSHLKGLNLEGFRNASFYQFFWSFLHSWWVGFFFGLRGYSDRVARLSSIVAYGVFLWTLYAAASRLREDALSRTAGYAALFAAFIPVSLPDFGVQCMQEIPALMTMGFALVAYREALERRRPLSWLAAGMLTTVCFFMKYNFGIVLAMAFGVLALMGVLVDRDHEYGRAMLLVFGPLIVAGVHWLVYPEFRIAEFLAIFQNRPQGPEVWSLEGLFFYPQGLFVECGWWGLLLVAACALGVRFRTDRWVRFLLITVCCVLIPITFQQTKVYRYLYPIYPALFLLVGFAAAVGFANVRFRTAARWGIVFIGVVLTARFIHAVEAARSRPPIRYAVEPVVENVVAALSDATAVFTVGEANLLSAGLIEWELLKRGRRVPVYESMLFKERLVGERPFDARTAVVSPQLDEVERILREKRCDAIVAVDVPVGTPLDDDDYQLFNAWKRPYVAALAEGPAWVRLRQTVRSEDLGCVVRLYSVALPGVAVR